MIIDINMNDNVELPIYGITLLIGKKENDRKEWLKSQLDYEYYVISKESKLIPWLSVKDNITFPYCINKEKISSILDLLSFNGIKDFQVNRISKLNKLKLLIGRAFAKNSNVIVLNDLTELIDIKDLKEFADFLTLISKDKLIIVSTNDSEIIDCFKGYAESTVATDDLIKLQGKHSKLHINFLFSIKTFFHNYISMLISIVLLSISFLGFGKMIDDLSFNMNSELFNQIKQKQISNIKVSPTYSSSRLNDEDFDQVVNNNNLVGAKTYSKDIRLLYDRHIINTKLIELANLTVAVYDEEFCSQFELIAGDYPSDENDVLLTDIQLTFFETFGYTNPLTYQVMSPNEVTIESLLNSPIYVVEPNYCYEICGFVKSNANLQEYRRFFQDCLIDKTDNYSFVEGVDDLCFISNILSQKLNARRRTSDCLEQQQILGFNNAEMYINRLSYFIPSDAENDILFFNYDKKELADDEIAIPLSSYLVNSDKFYGENKEYVLDKQYVFTGEEVTYTTTGYLFFTDVLKQAALNYVCEESYTAAFTNIETILEPYIYLYFDGQIPDVISIEDQKKIFSDYLSTAFSSSQLENQYLSEVISLYRTMVRDYMNRYLSEIFNQKATLKSKTHTREFTIVGFNIFAKNYIHSTTVSKKTAEELCGPRYNGNYDSFIIKTDDSENFKKCISIINSNNQEIGVNDYRLVNVNTKDLERIQSEINSRLPSIISLSIIFLAFGIIALVVYYKRNIVLLTDDKNTKTISYVNVSIVLLISLIIGFIGIAIFTIV